MNIETFNEYRLGIKSLDNEHKELFTLCSDIYNSSLTNEEVKTMLLDYYDLVFNHFISEETYMEEINFPDIDHHKESHQQILYKIFNAVDDSKTCELYNRKKCNEINR